MKCNRTCRKFGPAFVLPHEFIDRIRAFDRPDIAYLICASIRKRRGDIVIPQQDRKTADIRMMNEAGNEIFFIMKKIIQSRDKKILNNVELQL